MPDEPTIGQHPREGPALPTWLIQKTPFILSRRQAVDGDEIRGPVIARACGYPSIQVVSIGS